MEMTHNDTEAEAALAGILAAADTGDGSKMDNWLASEAKHHMNGLLMSNDELKKRAAAFKTAFPDIKRDLAPVASSGKTATVRGWISGTQQGEFMGKPASGKRFEISALGFCKINEAGKIVELTVEMNMLAMMEQLRGD